MMDAFRVFFEGVGIFFLLYMIGYSTFLLLAVMIGASTLYENRRKNRLKNVLDKNYYVPVSIIVPAYNEELTVVDTVKSLLALDYKAYEIIVVDDGSVDHTAQVLVDAFNMQPIRRPIHRLVPSQKEKAIFQTFSEKVPISLVRKKNGGKADAINMGINMSQYPYFICIDADSVLQHDSLREIVRPILEDDNVIAVGGSVRPYNGNSFENGKIVAYHMPHNLLASMQVLEYDRSFLASRILFDKFNGSLIISGAFGIFKKDLVVACGGYDASTLGEDMELVVRMHEFCLSNGLSYRIRYASEALCWTQVPERLKDLCVQRRRWHLGLFQSITRHKRLFGNVKYGLVSIVSYLYFLLYELLSPYIELFGVATVIIAYFLDLINISFMILFFLIYAFFGAIITLTAFFSRIQTANYKMRVADLLKALLLCFIEVTFLRFVLALVRVTAFRGYRKKKMEWGKIERKRFDG